MFHLSLSPVEIEQLHEALTKAFPFDHQVVQLSLFGAGVPLGTLIGPTAGTSEKILKLIEFANAQNKATALLTKAREMNPGNALLKKAAGDYLVHEQVEAIVRDDPELFPDPEVFRDRMAERERAVCRIKFPISQTQSESGTGFLVGKDLVMTCQHVLESIINGTVPASSVDLRFGYRILADKTQVPGEGFQLASNWLVANDPTLDFCLVRLKSVAEGQVLGTYPGAPQRRKIDLEQHKEGELRNTIVAIQHPNSEPLKVTFGSITNVYDDRITYDANTFGGSSGSPILLDDCTVTALHRQGFDKLSNAGVRISKIYEQLIKDVTLSNELSLS